MSQERPHVAPDVKKVMLNEAFQAACQNYAIWNGSSGPIAAAALSALSETSFIWRSFEEWSTNTSQSWDAPPREVWDAARALKNAAPQGLSQPAAAKAESEAQCPHLQGAVGPLSGEAPAGAASDRAELIRYWKTFPAASNEVAAAEIIEKLDRQLAKVNAALDAAGFHLVALDGGDGPT